MALKPNYYETLYVVRPDLKEDELQKIQSKLPEFIQAHDGEIMRSDKWAERELAYEIQDHTRGTYYILIFKAMPTVTKDIEKHLGFYNTDVLRFMTVKINEEAAVREQNAAKESAAEPEARAETPPAETVETPEAPAEPEVTQEPTEAQATEPETAQKETTEAAPTEETEAQPETPQQTPQEEPQPVEEPEAGAQEEVAPESEEEGGKE